ncbi:MAG: hypothetical protein ACI95R_000940 [Halioglobus sp.]|jgi:hypothetical protein
MWPRLPHPWFLLCFVLRRRGRVRIKTAPTSKAPAGGSGTGAETPAANSSANSVGFGTAQTVSKNERLPAFAKPVLNGNSGVGMTPPGSSRARLTTPNPYGLPVGLPAVPIGSPAPLSRLQLNEKNSPTSQSVMVRVNPSRTLPLPSGLGWPAPRPAVYGVGPPSTAVSPSASRTGGLPGTRSIASTPAAIRSTFGITVPEPTSQRASRAENEAASQSLRCPAMSPRPRPLWIAIGSKVPDPLVSPSPLASMSVPPTGPPRPSRSIPMPAMVGEAPIAGPKPLPLVPMFAMISTPATGVSVQFSTSNSNTKSLPSDPSSPLIRSMSVIRKQKTSGASTVAGGSACAVDAESTAMTLPKNKIFHLASSICFYFSV